MVEIEERLPTTAEYRSLRSAVGWTCPAVADCAAALEGSTGGVCAMDDGQIVGMGRIVGDAFYRFIVDVVVDPHHQRSGVGAAIVRSLEGVAAPATVTGRVGLVAGRDVAAFYTGLGYEDTGSVFLSRNV
jgi:GNAT superfamily N-acetyltransferase